MMDAKTRAWALRAVVFGALVSAPFAQAQSLRDPTIAPVQASAAVDAPAPAQSPLGAEGTSVIVRDGKAGLVQGTRIVFPGQKWGRWTLDRITETEVWLRDGTTLRKLQRFSGIQRSDPAVRAAACAARSATSAPAAATRKKTQRPPTSIPADTHCDAPPTRSSNP